MSHLSRDRLLDAAERGGTPEDAAHLASCARCRTEVEGLQKVLADIRGVEMPEPSPLFWEHLSGRVRAAIATDPAFDVPPGGIRSWRWARPVLVATAVAIVALIVGRAMVPRPGADRLQPARAAAMPENSSVNPGNELVTDDGWQLIVDVAGASDWQAIAADGDLHPGSSEMAVSELSADEQRELVRLLNEELTAAAAPGRARKGDV